MKNVTIRTMNITETESTIKTVSVKCPFFVKDADAFGKFAEYSAYENTLTEKDAQRAKALTNMNKAKDALVDADGTVEKLQSLVEAGKLKETDDSIADAVAEAITAKKRYDKSVTSFNKADKAYKNVVSFKDDFPIPEGYIETAIVNGFAQFFIGGFRLDATPFKTMSQKAIAYQRDYSGEPWNASRKDAFQALREVLEIRFNERIKDASEALPDVIVTKKLEFSSNAVSEYAASQFIGYRAEQQLDKVLASRAKYANAAKAANQFYGLCFNKLGSDWKDQKNKGNDYKGAKA